MITTMLDETYDKCGRIVENVKLSIGEKIINCGERFRSFELVQENSADKNHHS